MGAVVGVGLAFDLSFRIFGFYLIQKVFVSLDPKVFVSLGSHPKSFRIFGSKGFRIFGFSHPKGFRIFGSKGFRTFGQSVPLRSVPKSP